MSRFYRVLSLFISHYSLRVFPMNVCWWSFTEVWETASILKAPGLFSVFWPISVMLLFWRFPLFLLFLTPSVLVSNLLVIVPKHQVLILLFIFFHFCLWSAGTAKSIIQQVLSLLLIIIRSRQIINRYIANMSPRSTPATMSKKFLSPSGEWTFTFVIYRVSLWRRQCFGGDRRPEEFAPSSLCVWSQMHWTSLQIIGLPQDFCSKSF